MSAPDTIAALITGAGPAAVAIVRLSGPDAQTIAQKVCARWPPKLEPRRAFLTPFVRGGQPFDEGLVLAFAAPASYTGEDVVELQGHGGHAARVLLSAVVEAGARPAEAGEFTRRAYLAGRLDASQAEAVALLIAAQTERALKAANAMVGGALSRQLDHLESALGQLRGRVEGLLGFAEEATGAEAGLPDDCSRLASDVSALADTFGRGRRIFAGATVVLAGPANAGKSSLLNALVGEERALVDPAPGTTRDLVHADLELGGLSIRLVDTAGWRAAEGLEARGIALGQEAARRADLVLWVVDGRQVQPTPEPGWLSIWNKVDVAPGVVPGWLGVSAQTGEGLGGLRSALLHRLEPAGAEDEQVVVGTVRQAQALKEAAGLLQAASRQPLVELAAEDLRWAAQALGRVRGRALDADVMDAVFAQFCIGK